MTSEFFSVGCFSNFDLLFNVLLEDGSVIRAEFSKISTGEVIQSKIAEKLKIDLKKYFKGNKVDFSGYSVKLDGFTKHVLEEVRKIPFGEVITYGELATKVSSSPRAVGQALKRNPAPVIIPCHRIVSVDGIGGYSQGINIKRMLLELEGIEIEQKTTGR